MAPTSSIPCWSRTIGLALHQRDETRYFDGVQGDRTQQGELFGIKNLLTFEREESDVLQKSGTRKIIQSGRNGFDVDSDDGEAGADARLFRVAAADHPAGAVRNVYRRKLISSFLRRP